MRASSTKPPVFRFAPSPNGELHLGHAYSALLNLKMARRVGGKILLRIEDIDTVRCTPELETRMLKDLEWLGFEWDEPPRRQSEHFGEYAACLARLEESGLLFPSVLSRSELRKLVREKTSQHPDWPHDPECVPHYPGSEHFLDAEGREALKNSGKAWSLRLDTALIPDDLDLTWQESGSGEGRETVKADPWAWGKPVIARKDTPASYILCCVMDDAIQGVTTIVRGRDLYHATSLHRLVQTLLDLPEPQYHHHALVRDGGGKKLSKSRKDTSLYQLQQSGVKPSDILEMLEERGLSFATS